MFDTLGIGHGIIFWRVIQKSPNSNFARQPISLYTNIEPDKSQKEQWPDQSNIYEQDLSEGSNLSPLPESNPGAPEYA